MKRVIKGKVRIRISKIVYRFLKERADLRY